MNAAMEWRWQDEVPQELRPLPDQWLMTAGWEHWVGWDFLMLDYWDRDTNKYIARYAACPDWHWHWVPNGPMQAGTVNYGWNPDIRVRGVMLMVRECKWLGKKKGILVHMDDNHPTRPTYFWRCSIWGCYVAHYFE
jgi:hypothetical protein